MIESVKLKNISTNTEITIDKDESLYVLDVADFGTIESSVQTTKGYNQVGSSISSVSLGIRTVSITGWVIGDTEQIIEQKKKVLSSLVNPLQDIKATVKDNYQIIIRPKNTVKYSSNYKENNEVLCKFLISGTCYSPLFESVEISESNITQDTTVMNYGTFETGFKLVLTAEGAVVNPKVTMDSGEFILINKTLSNGEVITIDTQEGNQMVVGTLNGVTNNYYRYWDFDSKWVKLKLGSNTLSLSAESGLTNITAVIQFTHKYLEVQ